MLPADVVALPLWREAPALCHSLAYAGHYRWPILRVIDGDTVKVDAGTDMPPELASLSVRLRGVDTPEKGGHAKCDAERAVGQAATAFTQAALAEADSIVVRDPPGASGAAGSWPISCWTASRSHAL